jgi:hypothetical protein
MPSWGTARMLVLVALIAAAAFAAAPAQAAAPGAHTTVTGCSQAGALTVVGAVKMSGRRLRGASLQMRFAAIPLFGLPQVGAWKTIGTKTKGSGQQTFSGLGADQWFGLMSWRFKKGRKTVASGDERSQPGRVGAVRGAASCTLAEGTKPPDTVPPTVYILPLDQVWHHAPTPVAVYATDDYSGVRTVTYSIDGGPPTQIPNNTLFQIATEGAHSVHVTATDVAGNTGTFDTVVRVDAAPPSAPVIKSPPSVTAFTAPTFSWAPSTDTGSGLRGYVLQIKRASDGAVIATTTYGPDSTTAGAPSALTDGETYTAQLFAFDNTDVAWSNQSAPYTFHVDTQPGIASSSPANGAIVSSPSNKVTITLDRPATGISNSSVTFTAVDSSASAPAVDSVTCSASCTILTVTLHSAPGEGIWQAALNGVKSQENVPITGSVRFAVPFATSDTDSASSPSVCVTSTSNSAGRVYSVPTNDTNERGRFTFDWSMNHSSSWSATVYAGTNNGGMVLGSTGGTGASGHVSFDFNLGAKGGTNSIFFQFTIPCENGNSTSLSVSNIFGTRLP